MKRTAVFLIICMLMILPAAAAEAPAGLSSVQAPCALLMAGDGTVIFEKNAHEKREPASVTKIMTMLLVMEAVDSGRLALEDTVTVSATLRILALCELYLLGNDLNGVNLLTVLVCIIIVQFGNTS